MKDFVGFIKKNADRFLLFFILCIAVFLRTYRIWDIPFTYDEFSAISRTNFNNISDLIEYGVKIDAHPVGIQILLYGLVKIFGISEFWIKLPFILFGVLSVYFIYRIAAEWFNKTSALVIAAMVAFMQYTITYSQIARPYISGLFFTSLMVWFWTKVVLNPDKKIYGNLAGYIIASALCAYNHHFSLLQAAITGFTGLFFIRKQYLKHYIIAGILIFACYIPHLKIFFYQLKIGGVEEWLGKPGAGFIFDYFFYLFHFSYYFLAVAVILIIISFRNFFPADKKKKLFTLVSIAWFVIPYLTGFFYSVYVNSVLQFSVLIFSFPFLLFVLFGNIPEVRPLKKILIIALIFIVGCGTLIFERKYYNYFYNSPLREPIIEAAKTVDSTGRSNCAVLFSLPEYSTNYYYNKYTFHKKFSYINILGYTKIHIDSLLRNINTPFLAYGETGNKQIENFALISYYYPYLLKKTDYSGGNFYLFSRSASNRDIKKYFFTSQNGFESNIKFWTEPVKKFLDDSVKFHGAYSYVFDSLSEWGPAFTAPLYDLTNHKNNVVDISLFCYPLNGFTNALLVSEIASDTTEYWNANKFNQFSLYPGRWNRIVLSIKLSDIKIKGHNPKLKIFVWNNDKCNFLIDDFDVKIREGNKSIYWTVRKV